MRLHLQRVIWLTTFWCFSVITFSMEPNFILDKLYTKINSHQIYSMSDRLDFFSNQLINKPYLLGALGEGPEGQFDQCPLYRFDSFDCETYVDTVLALALARNQLVFKQCINKIRYKNGQVDFITRNHFTSLDWNENAQKQGFLKDITLSILDKNKQPIAQLAVAVIDKPSWYNHLTLDALKLPAADKQQQLKRLMELKIQGNKLPKTSARIFYLPLNVLFDHQGRPNKDLFKQIPNAAIIEIVRPNWDLTKQMGTHLNVSHMGFAFWKNDVLFFRQASSRQGKVTEEPLISYLQKNLRSPTIKGINVQILVPQKTLTGNCLIK